MITHLLTITVSILCCTYSEGSLLERNTRAGDCPPQPESVELEIAVDRAGNGLLPCSLSEHPVDNAVILFTWHIEGSKDVWHKEIKSPEKSGSLPFNEIVTSLLNKKISCTAQLKFDRVGAQWCDKVESNSVTPNIICPAQSKLTVVEGLGPENLLVKLSAPPSMYCIGKDKNQCEVEVLTEIVPNDNDLKCSKTEVIPQVVLESKSCGVQITKNNWKTGVTIPIKASIDRINDGERVVSLIITVRFKGLEIVEEKCENNVITVVDQDETAICHSVNDPHIRTFDNFYYDNHLTGEFVLYKHKKLPYQVIARYAPCGAGPIPTCNCAAAIQTGDDVITFNSCDAPQNKGATNTVALSVKVFTNGELTTGTRIKQIGQGQKFEVHLPTGTVVTLTPSYYSFMNIIITASTADFGNTEGLCGDFNGITQDDFKGLTADQFNNKWRSTNTIFNGVLPEQTPATPTYCSCIQGAKPVVSSGLDVYSCTDPDPNDATELFIKNAKTPKPNTKTPRRKRQINQDTGNTEGVSIHIDEAENLCRDMLEKSDIMKVCGDQITSTQVKQSVEDCVKDIMTTGQKEWAVSHLRDLGDECLIHVVRNQSVWTGASETPGQPDLPQAMVTQLCAEGCGPNGQCVKTVCECSEGYAGDRCQFGPDTQPEVYGLSWMTCDTQRSSCLTVILEGKHFSKFKDFFCHLQYATITDTAEKTKEKQVVPAEAISWSAIACTLPALRSGYISLSSDRSHEGERAFLYVVHNSSCQICTLNDNQTNVQCQIPENQCGINGKCYMPDEVDPEDSCNICSLEHSNTTWTRKTDSACLRGDSPLSQKDIIIIAVVCGAAVLLAIIIAVVCLLRKKRRQKKHVVKKDYREVSLHETKTDETEKI